MPADLSPDLPLPARLDLWFSSAHFTRATLNFWLALWGEVAVNADLQIEHRRNYGAFRAAVARAIVRHAPAAALHADDLATALITVEPRPFREGDSFVVRVNSPGGANYTAAIYPRGADSSEGALTGITDVDPADRPTILLSTIGLAPGAYDAVLMSVDGAELARSRFQIVPEDGRPGIEVISERVISGYDIALQFHGAPGFKLDWVGIYAKGEPSVYNYLGFAYTGARIDGNLDFPADALYDILIPGDYEARLMFDDHYRVLAVAPFTVVADK